MRIRRLHLLLATLTFGLLLQTNLVFKQTSASPQASDWVTFAPPDEEISVPIPALPVIRNWPTKGLIPAVLPHRTYDGYGDGFIYVIDSFKAEHPEKYSSQLRKLPPKQGVFERLFFDGAAAELFRTTVNHRYATYSKRTLRFMTEKHLYVIELMSLQEFNPAVDRFLSSLKLRKPGEQSVPLAPYAVASAGPILNPNEVTRPAIIVWRSEPWYTQDARFNQTKGTVILDLILADNGYVLGVRTVQRLENGLTEAAIEAATNTRFFPAEKDGKPVSQRTRMEYNFNIY